MDISVSEGLWQESGFERYNMGKGESEEGEDEGDDECALHFAGVSGDEVEGRLLK